MPIGPSTDSDPTLFSRYECKYLLSPLAVPELRHFLSPFMRPDRFAAIRPGNRYPICSLYLDGEDLPLYQQTVGGEKNRYKLRVRTYSDREDTPVFLEVKRKVNNIVQKRRARIERRRLVPFLSRAAADFAERDALGVDDDLGYFDAHRDRIDAKPVVKIRYLREAYESNADEPVRVTIDTELMHAAEFNSDVSHSSGRWVTTPVEGVIVEIKYTELCPYWVRDMVRFFDLKQQPVPKYVLSLDHMLLDGRESVLALRGVTLPQRRV